MALYLCRKATFWVSLDTDTYTKDTMCGSLDTEPVSWLGIAKPHFLYREYTVALFPIYTPWYLELTLEGSASESEPRCTKAKKLLMSYGRASPNELLAKVVHTILPFSILTTISESSAWSRRR